VLAADFEVKPSLTFFLPVALEGERAHPRPTQGSGDFTSLLGTDGFVELPPGPTLVNRDTPVPFYRW
jgi:molybdopterin molybdotransferase